MLGTCRSTRRGESVFEHLATLDWEHSGRLVQFLAAFLAGLLSLFLPHTLKLRNLVASPSWPKSVSRSNIYIFWMAWLCCLIVSWAIIFSSAAAKVNKTDVFFKILTRRIERPLFSGMSRAERYQWRSLIAVGNCGKMLTKIYSVMHGQGQSLILPLTEWNGSLVVKILLLG